MLQTFRQTGKSKCKKRGYVSSFHVSFQSYGRLIVQKIAFFLQFCAELRKNSHSIKAIYIYGSESSRYDLSENGFLYYAMTDCLGDKVEKFC